MQYDDFLGKRFLGANYYLAFLTKNIFLKKRDTAFHNLYSWFCVMVDWLRKRKNSGKKY